MLIDGTRSLPPYAALDVDVDNGVLPAPLTFDPAGHHAYLLTGARVSDRIYSLYAAAAAAAVDMTTSS